MTKAHSYLAPGWVSVDRCLPDNTAHVLGVTASGHMDIYARVGIQIAMKDKRKDMRVTHWMPLPPLPDAEKREKQQHRALLALTGATLDVVHHKP